MATDSNGACKTKTSGNQVSDSVQVAIPSSAAVQAGNDIQITKPFKGAWSCEEAGDDDSNEKREYRYSMHDAMGNWTKKVTDSGGEQTTTKRILSYYE